MILIVFGFSIFTDYASNIHNLYWIIVIYILSCILLYQINLKYKNKVFDFVVQLVFLPFSLLNLLVKVTIVILPTHLYLLVYLGFSFLIPYVFYRIDEKILITGFKEETWCYLIITTGVVIATLLHKQITFLIFKLSSFARKSVKMKRLNLVEICEYIVSINNIKLVIYSLFFIALIAFNILNFQLNSYYDNPNIDKAILQSFVTYIALERIITNLKKTEFRPSELLKSIKLSIFNETEITTEKKSTGNL